MDDLISRQTAIKAICEDGTWLESQGCTEITMAERKQRDADILSDLPSAQQWIPCSERLPAYGEDVILSIGKYCNVGYFVAVNDETDVEWYYSGWYHTMNDVSAWMPLPEPYKEGNDG